MEWYKRHSANCYRRFWLKQLVPVTRVLHRGFMLAMLIIIASSTSSAAQEIGNAKAGREYAIDHCASCHAIYGSDTESVNPNAAPFAEIAVTPGMNSRALAVWLSSVHNEMPDFIAEKNDMENVIAYILSSPSARIAAANTLLDRGYGRARQSQDVEPNGSDAFLQIWRMIGSGELSSGFGSDDP